MGRKGYKFWRKVGKCVEKVAKRCNKDLYFRMVKKAYPIKIDFIS
jgi:hypothetical protein